MSSIIVVDDDITMIRLVQVHLRKVAVKGHYFQNATDCLKAAADIMPDVALLDYDLPDAKGTALMDSLREIPGLENLPVLIFTARTGSELLPEIRDSGANGLLNKPFSPAHLVQEIQRLLSAA